MAKYRNWMNRTFLCGACIFLTATVLAWCSIIIPETSPVTTRASALPSTHQHRDPSLEYEMNLSVIASELTREFQHTEDFDFDKFQLNVTLSESLGLVRSVPDTRPRECQSMQAPDSGLLPGVSVIVPFHNEAWSILLRTIHTILSRTPRRLLKEVILVDDCSTHRSLQAPLTKYINTISHISLIRNTERLGLIKSRLIGAKRASAEVLIFVDAHIEVGYNWLPPLLEALVSNMSTIAIPHTDLIDPRTLEYTAWEGEPHGGFSWGMDYVWKWLPPRVKAQLKSPVDLIPTPTIIGCVIAVYRRVFFHLGAFDAGMLIWGGENIELSFRTWMCGGSVHIVPCSRAGHIFRSFLPYDFPHSYGGADVVLKNYQRVAEVWMGQYKEYYYRAKHKKVAFSASEMRSLQERIRLKQLLQCHDFQWYLDNVVPEMTIPTMDSVYFGQIKNLNGNVCLRANTVTGHNLLPLESCMFHSEDQQFSFTNSSHIQSYTSRCLVVTENGVIQLKSCADGGQSTVEWVFRPARQKIFESSLVDGHDSDKPIGRLESRSPEGQVMCMTQVSHQSLQIAWMSECDVTEQNLFQLWIFTYGFS